MNNSISQTKRDSFKKMADSLFAIDEKTLTQIFDKKISSITNLSFGTIWQAGKEIATIAWNKESKKEAISRNIRNGLLESFDQLSTPEASSKIINAFFNSNLSSKKQEIAELFSNESKDYFVEEDQKQAKTSLSRILEEVGKAIKYLKESNPAQLKELNNFLGDKIEKRAPEKQTTEQILSISKSLLKAQGSPSNILFNFVNKISDFTKSQLGFKIICNEIDKIQQKSLEDNSPSITSIFSKHKNVKTKQIGTLVSGASKIINAVTSSPDASQKVQNIIESYEDYKSAENSKKKEKFNKMIKSGFELLSNDQVINATSHFLQSNKELIVAALNQKLEEKRTSLEKKAAENNKTKLSFEEKILNNINGEFCYKMLQNANTPKGIKAIQNAIEKPSIANQIYAAYKTNNISLLITTTLSALTTSSKRKVRSIDIESFKNHNKNQVNLTTNVAINNKSNPQKQSLTIS